MSKVKIGDYLVGDGEPCFIIAEIGINHNGDVNIAKKLIDVAVIAGCNAVKFQKRTVDIVYTSEELAKPRENPFGTTNGDLKRALEFGYNDFVEISRYCLDKGILWLASCWDEPSIDLIEQFNPPCYKISSASLTDRHLLEYTRAQGHPIILSTGMSTMEQIRRAVKILGKENLVILHCTSTYPTPDEETHLRVMNALRKEFPNVPIGFSGHGYGTTISVCAVAMGACVLERHITLDRAMWGSDQAASLEPAGLNLMVKNIRRLEIALGDENKSVLESEITISKKLRRKDDI